MNNFTVKIWSCDYTVDENDDMNVVSIDLIPVSCNILDILDQIKTHIITFDLANDHLTIEIDQN